MSPSSSCIVKLLHSLPKPSFTTISKVPPPPLQLSPMEMDFLASHSSAALSQFEQVSLQGGASEKVLAVAGSEVESARK